MEAGKDDEPARCSLAGERIIRPSRVHPSRNLSTVSQGSYLLVTTTIFWDAYAVHDKSSRARPSRPCSFPSTSTLPRTRRKQKYRPGNASDAAPPASFLTSSYLACRCSFVGFLQRAQISWQGCACVFALGQERKVMSCMRCEIALLVVLVCEEDRARKAARSTKGIRSHGVSDDHQSRLSTVIPRLSSLFSLPGRP